MGATLRIELFPWSLNTAVDFYTRVLSFELLRYEPSDKPDTGYAHLRRDAIQLGLSTKTAEEYPAAAQDPAERARFRSCPTGTELVIEVDDLEAERSKIVSQGWELESEVVMQCEFARAERRRIQDVREANRKRNSLGIKRLQNQRSRWLLPANIGTWRGWA